MSEKVNLIKQSIQAEGTAIVTGQIGREATEVEFEEDVQVLEGIFAKRQKQPEVPIPLMATVNLGVGRDVVIQNMSPHLSISLLQLLPAHPFFQENAEVQEGPTQISPPRAFEVWLLRANPNAIRELFPDVEEYWRQEGKEMPVYWQVILPDEKGRWPWSAEGCDAMALLGQPVLGDLPDELAQAKSLNEQRVMEEFQRVSAQQQNQIKGDLEEFQKSQVIVDGASPLAETLPPPDQGES